MAEATVLIRRDGAVAWLYMNRPDKRNALNRQMATELARALEALATDDDIRVLVLSGSGDQAFCAGADMGEAVGSSETADRDDIDLPGRIWRFPKPTIAAVNGYAFGGGAVIAIACDLRIAATSASFRLPGAAYGLVVGASRLPSIVGIARAKELIFTARVVDAVEAAAIGLVNKVVPSADLEEEVRTLARTIADNSAAALRLSKQVMDAASGVEAAAQQEREANRLLRQSPEHQERFGQAARRIVGRRSAQ